MPPHGHMTEQPRPWRRDAESLLRIFEEVKPSDARTREAALLRAAAETVGAGGDARDLARALHLHPRALVRAADDTGLPPARRLLAWFRLLLAAKLLETDGVTVDVVAEACGYASGSSLARAVRELTSLPPTAFMAAVEPFAVMAAAFTQDLERHRDLRRGAEKSRGGDRSRGKERH